MGKGWPRSGTKALDELKIRRKKAREANARKKILKKEENIKSKFITERTGRSTGKHSWIEPDGDLRSSTQRGEQGEGRLSLRTPERNRSHAVWKERKLVSRYDHTPGRRREMGCRKKKRVKNAPSKERGDKVIGSASIESY